MTPALWVTLGVALALVPLAVDAVMWIVGPPE